MMGTALVNLSNSLYKNAEQRKMEDQREPTGAGVAHVAAIIPPII
jgi:hypothetical protein